METVTWLWLYDKRWMFNIRVPNLLKIWLVPMLLNTLFLASLLYYSFNHNDETCYNNFQTWIDLRMYILIALIICLACVWLKASKKLQTENHKLRIFQKSHHPELAKKYTYWLRRRLTMSFSGSSLLILGMINWIWTLYGMNLVYMQYSTITVCEQFMQDIVYGNLLLTGVFAFPVIWIMFWMIIIKAFCLILSVVWPSALIWINKKWHN